MWESDPDLPSLRGVLFLSAPAWEPGKDGGVMWRRGRPFQVEEAARETVQEGVVS